MNAPHLMLEKACRFAILPGDPGRINIIKKYLDNAKEVAYNREFRSVIGTYKGVEIIVTSTGIGCPSAAICVEELSNLGTEYFIRIGTCGGLLKEMQSGDIVIPFGAMRSEGTTKEYLPIEFPSIADLNLTKSLELSANDLNVIPFFGINRTHDSFYEPMDNFIQLKKYGNSLVSSEMECSAIFLTAMLRNKKAGAILIVNTPECPEEIEQDLKAIYKLTDLKKIEENMEKAIKIVLNTIYNIAKNKIS